MRENTPVWWFTTRYRDLMPLLHILLTWHSQITTCLLTKFFWLCKFQLWWGRKPLSTIFLLIIEGTFFIHPLYVCSPPFAHVHLPAFGCASLITASGKIAHFWKPSDGELVGFVSVCVFEVQVRNASGTWMIKKFDMAVVSTMMSKILMSLSSFLLLVS